MPLHPTWGDIALRLVLTVAAGAIVGFNRGSRGHAAGLRTTVLVSLAATVAAILANVLLQVEGRDSSSFSDMDVMRLPLGILTGVGFIGGGAIMRRGDLLTGVTTAATLWVMTVIGLCFGSGAYGLGIVSTALSVLTLWGLRWFELRYPREQRGLLVIEADEAGYLPLSLQMLLSSHGYAARFWRQRRDDHGRLLLSFEITWQRSEVAAVPMELPELVSQQFHVVSFEMTSEFRT